MLLTSLFLTVNENLINVIHIYQSFLFKIHNHSAETHIEKGMRSNEPFTLGKL